MKIILMFQNRKVKHSPLLLNSRYNKKSVVLLISLLVVPLIVTTSCENKESCEYSSCDPQRSTVKTAQNALGRVTILDAQHPETWVIVSEEGTIGEDITTFDGPDIVVPCNFPSELKEDGIKVTFSGELKESCNDFPPSLSKIYYSRLSKIEKTSDL